MTQRKAANAAPAQGSGPSMHDLPVQTRAAQLQPATFNDAENSVDVVWTTGARVRRYDWYNDTPFEEELAVTTDAVDMSRFDAGAVQVLDGHQTYGGVSAILGRATTASIVGGEGRATLQLSQRDELAGVVKDIKAGIIRAVSFGYSVQRYEITRAQDRTDGVNMPLYRAVRWQPQEISFVTVPADANAGTRSQPTQGGLPCEFIRAAAQPSKDSTMTEAELQAQRADEAAAAVAASAAAATATRAAADAAAAAATAAATTRAADITALCTRHAVPHLADTLIRSAKSVDQAGVAILDELATRSNAQGGHLNVRGVQLVGDETQTRLQGIEEAVAHRIDPKAALTDNGRQYRGMSLIEVGRDHLERCGVNTRGMSRMQLATQVLSYRANGMSTTSDFANLLANVANKRLRQGYQENQPSYTRWARRAPNAPDFKSMSVVQLGGAPDLLQTNEHGEFKYGTMTDGAETYSMLTYGRIVSFSRQALVNDDLRGFDRLIGAFGNSAARLENRTAYLALTTNAALADTGALFNATATSTAGGHANLTGTGTAISVASLGVGRALMRVQKGYQSEELNLAPSFLIVPAALEQIAYQFTSANYVPTTPSGVSEFRAGGRTALEPIVEAVLDANSATSWYLAASNAQVDTVEYCYLDGSEGPVIESEMGFEVDGISYKCRLDFAAKAIDYRGLYKNVGV